MNETIDIPLGSGTNEAVDDNLTPFEQSRVCNNAVFPNGVTAQKRPGLTSVYTNNGLPALRRLGKRQNELLVFDNANLSVYSEQGGLSLITRGAVSPCIASRQLLGSGNATTTAFNTLTPLSPYGAVAEDSRTKLRVNVWCDLQSVIALVYDAARKKTVRVDTLSDNATNPSVWYNTTNQPHVCIVNSVAFALWLDKSSDQVYYSSLDLTVPSSGWSAPALALGAVREGDVWDACAIDGASLITIGAGLNAVSTAYLAVFTVTGTTMGLSAAVNVEVTTGTPFTACAVSANSTDGIVFAYAKHTTGDTLYWAAYTTGLVINTAVASIWSTTGTGTEGKILSIGIARYTGQGSGASAEYVICLSRQNTVVPATVLSGSPFKLLPAFYSLHITRTGSGAGNIHGPILGYKQLSKPIAIPIGASTRVFCVCQFYDGNPLTSLPLSNSNSTIVVVEPDLTASGNAWLVKPPAAVCAPLFAGQLATPTATDVALSTTTTGFVACGLEQESDTKINATSLLFDFLSPALYQTVELGSWAWIAAGVPMIYDGQQVMEVGFVNPPITPQSQASLGGGTLTSNSTLQYTYCYAWQDDDGNVHRSKPSPFSDAIDCTAGASALEVTVYPCRQTYRTSVSSVAGDVGANPIQIEVYRNRAATPDIWQLCAILENDITNTGVISFSDTCTDTTLQTRPFLYTTGGAVSSDPAPSLSSLCVHADRIFGISEDGAQSFFTTTLVRGEAPRFSDSFTIDWPEGPIQAQWSLETRLHAATDSKIFSMFGSGPSDTNTGSDFSPVQPWQEDLGVVDPRGIASFTGGTIFQSKRGLMLEGRDGSYTWIGAQVQRTQTAYPVVTAIAPLTTDGAIRIALKQTDTHGANGLVLHWDHRHQRWSTHYTASTNWVNLGAESVIEVAGTCYMLMNRNSNLALLQETASTCLDDTNWVTLKVVTGWAHPGSASAPGSQNLQGWTRLDRVIVDSDQVSPHGLTVQVARDYSSTFDSAQGTWTSTDLAGLTVERVEFQPATQACAAFSVAVADSAPDTPDSNGQGPVFKILTAAYRNMGGQYRNVATSLRR